MKNILDLYLNKTIMVSDGEVLEFDDINLDSGTKARIVDIITCNEGWMFILDFFEFVVTNVGVNQKYGIVAEDLKKHRVWRYDIAKYPELFPFDI